MRTYKILFIIAVIVVSFLFFGKYFFSGEEKITIIVKIRDEIQIAGKNKSLPNFVKFPNEYFKTQDLIKKKYLGSTTKLELNTVQFIQTLVTPNTLEAAVSGHSNIPFINTPIIKIDSITPLFSNYDDVFQVMNEAALNNNRGKYMFTNLFNYIKIDVRVNKIGKGILEKIFQSFLFSSRLFNKQKIIEYFYFPGIVTPAATTGVGTSTTLSDYRNVLGITSLESTSNWGRGAGINIIDFDEGVTQRSTTNWRFTESGIDASTHGNQVMSVLFGGACDSTPLTGLVSEATAEVVSYTDFTRTGQYSQFLYALRQSLVADASIGRVKSRILLIEVHNQVAVNNQDILPLESDPAMFFLIRLGSFGLKLVIVEAAGNGKVSLDTLLSTYFNSTFRGIPLGEFSSLITRSKNSVNIEATPLQIDATTATVEEIRLNTGFNYNVITGSLTPSNWLSIWSVRPSGAILIAGYEPSTSKCNTNYGSKVKIIGPGNDVGSLKFDGTTPCKIEPFNKSSAASVVITGVVASALSKDTSKTEGDIKRALYGHPSSMPLIRGMKVPNVPNFYTYLSPPPAP